MTAATADATPPGMPAAFDILHSAIPGVAWPPLVQGVAALVEAYVSRLEVTEWLPIEEIEQAQREQLGLLADHCARHSPAFARRLAAADLTAVDLAQPGGLARLPSLTRRGLQDHDGLFCAQVPEAHQPVGMTQTSGSTGEPTRVRRTGLNKLGHMAMTVRDHRWQSRDARGRLVAMSAHRHEVKPLPDWGEPLALLYRTGPALSLPATMAVAELHARIADFAPQVLVTYPSVLGAMLDIIECGGRQFQGLAHVRCMSEMVHPDLRARTQALLGRTIEDAYTSEEFGFLALQCPDADGYHIMAETHIVEVIDDNGKPCAPGEWGRVLVTDLHNFATPLIRYAIGDYAMAGTPCACRRGLPRIERIMGRERNLVVTPDGARHWPLTGYSKFHAIAPVRHYQLIQRDLETVEMRLVVAEPLSSAQEAKLRALIQTSVGHPFDIRLTYFADALPPDPSGKREEFVSLVAG
ncbi:phenylacetate--CoA ligase family protein [Novosphingobium sp. Gsoil 351]|uniref:phenylacetate--CoA ligase family protein n=1 Tax=Novosphingobium sp. Gsoil 351 TaxID=2675225 RepID=UPI0018A87A55|nr:phenylacetate--CoA ligase family protein [Novosphingobium sp. Gsoil 351]